MQVRNDIERRNPSIEQRSLDQRESLGDLLGQLANNSAALVRDEVDLVKQEMTEKLNQVRSGLTVIAVGAVLGLGAFFTLCAAAVIGLGHYVGPGYAALIIGMALLLIGGMFALKGIGQLKRTSLKPEQTIETLQEDKEWLKEMT